MDDDGGIGEAGLLWLVNGEERPFEPAGRGERPWLEESAEWGRSAADSGSEDQDPPDSPKDDAPQLVWL